MLGIPIHSFLLVSSLLIAGHAFASSSVGENDFEPDFPMSTFLQDSEGMSADYCMEWNPEFAQSGFRCCADPLVATKGRRGRIGRPKLRQCSPSRLKGRFCTEMTDDQKEYSDLARDGALGDLLVYLESQVKTGGGSVSHCGANNGFLVRGRQIIPTEQNRIRIRAPHRCAEFGTDRMALLMEWLGRQIDARYPRKEYPTTQLVIADISAPRGGCLAGSRGRRGHASHTNGKDADIAFLWGDSKRNAPDGFHQVFHPESNWWMIKKIFENPYVCIQKIFVDRKWIKKISQQAGDDPTWALARKYVQHVKGHRQHYHIRIGDKPGAPGCIGSAILEDDGESDFDGIYEEGSTEETSDGGGG
jgi:murein endopeptidase